MSQVAKAAAFVAVAATAWIAAQRLRGAPPGTTVVVERGAWLPQRMVRVTEREVVYQGAVIASVPVCPDSACFKIDALFEQLETTEPAVPRGAFEPARLVLVELDASADVTTVRQVMNTIAAAGYWPVVDVARELVR